MAPVLIIAHLHTAGGAARQEVIDALTKVSVYSKESEPDVTRYAVAIPRDTSNDKSVFAVEEYQSQEAFDKHMASKPVQDLIAHFTANPTIFSAAGDIFMLEPTSSYARPALKTATDPFITYASIDYKPGKRAEAIEAWKTVTLENQKNEPDTLGYAIAVNKESDINVQSFEIYASEKYFKEVHVPSPQVQENFKNYGPQIRDKITHEMLKFVGGYLHKSDLEVDVGLMQLKSQM